MNKNQRQSGFTLVELLVSMVLIGIVMGLLTNYLLTNYQQSVEDGARGSMLEETESGLDVVANDIRLSANADDTNRWPDPNGPSGTSNEYSWNSNSSTLILATAAQDSSGSVIFSDPKDYVTEKNNLIYFVNSGTLYERMLAAPVSGNVAVTSCPAASATASCPADKTILHNVTNFTVTYFDGNDSPTTTPTNARSIQLQVTTSKTLYGHPISQTYTTQMVFRND